jgi:hypothetical protein
VLGMPPAFNLSQDQTLHLKALSFMKNVSPVNYSVITKNLTMVLTFDFAIAIANASTHTNYLITLLKSDLKTRGQSPFFNV